MPAKLKSIRTYLFSFLIFLISVAPVTAGEKNGTFIKVIENASGSFNEVGGAVESGLKNASWDLLGTYDTGVPEGCGFRSRVIVFSSKDYAASIMEYGVKAAFALPLRAGVYEDESGIHVSIVNPASINRTVVDETALDAFSRSTTEAIIHALSKAVSGNVVDKQIGQLRSKGKISGMGGGKFTYKIEEIYTAGDDDDSTLRKTAGDVEQGIRDNKKGWELLYTYDLSSYGAVVFGVKKSKTEERAFTIAGEKRASSEYKCPGIDHGAAFPIEVVVYKDGGTVKVVTLDGMYRMKLYFEDAGMWAFMKNMSMPGEIENEIIEMSRIKLN